MLFHTYHFDSSARDHTFNRLWARVQQSPTLWTILSRKVRTLSKERSRQHHQHKSSKASFETEIYISLFSLWAFALNLRSSGTITGKPTKDSHIWDIIYTVDSYIKFEFEISSKCRNHRQISTRPHPTSLRIAATTPHGGTLSNKHS